MSETITSLPEVVARANALLDRGRRVILGLVGAPGAGKSTISAALVQGVGAQRSIVVPMDGFHLANVQLAAQGLADIKGNIATFDAHGYASLLQRLREQRPDETVYAPYFDRDLEESIGSAIRVEADVPLIITEGNYLLSDGAPWQRANSYLDETWYVRVPDELRVRWLIARHIAHGRSPEAAREWVLRSDEANARLVERTADRADVIVQLPVGDVGEADAAGGAKAGGEVSGG